MALETLYIGHPLTKKERASNARILKPINILKHRVISIAEKYFKQADVPVTSITEWVWSQPRDHIRELNRIDTKMLEDYVLKYWNSIVEDELSEDTADDSVPRFTFG